jgi:hypothetical protein
MSYGREYSERHSDSARLKPVIRRFEAILVDTLSGLGYEKGRNLTQAASDGGISDPTLRAYLTGRAPEGARAQAVFRGFLRRLGISEHAFRGVLPRLPRPTTRLGRRLLPGLQQKGRTISEAARIARLPMTVWAWIWGRSTPRPDQLRVFLDRNGIDPARFAPWLREAHRPTRVTPFSAYLAAEQLRRGLTWKEFVGFVGRDKTLQYKRLWRWSRGGTLPSPAAAARLLAALETPEPQRSELLQVAVGWMAAVAQGREGHQGPARCRICERERPAWTAKGEPTYDRQTNTFEHLVCRRRLRGWRDLRDHIRGLSETHCRRFAGMRSVPIICPTPGCGLRRETRVGQLTPFVRASSGHRRRAARVTCDGGQLFRACRECHGRKVGRTRTATGQAPIREVHRAAVIEHFGVPGRRQATDLLNRARQGSETARREVFSIWSKATRKRLRADWRGPAPEKTLAAIVRGLKTRQFTCCHWCGLVVAPRTSRRWAFHGRCFTALRHTPEWRRRWKEVVRDPIRLDRVVRDPQTGRWRPRPGHRQSRPLRGAFEPLLERRWNRVRPGPTPSPRNLGLGCEAFIRRHAWDQSDLTIAKALKIRRQEVANVRETFEAHAPGPGDAADALRGTDGQRSHGEPVGWQLIFPGLSDRATVVLADRCPLLGHGSDRVALVRALDRLATPRDYIPRLTGVPSPTLHEPR